MSPFGEHYLAPPETGGFELPKVQGGFREAHSFKNFKKIRAPVGVLTISEVDFTHSILLHSPGGEVDGASD